LFADYERRGSASQDHEESRIILAQKIEKETVGSKNSARSIGGRDGGREEESKGLLLHNQTFYA